MPLTDKEKRALEELEAQLSAEDPRFALAMVTDPFRTHRRKRLGFGLASVSIGIAVLVAAVIMHAPWLGAIAFFLITLGAADALTTLTRVGARHSSTADVSELEQARVGHQTSSMRPMFPAAPASSASHGHDAFSDVRGGSFAVKRPHSKSSFMQRLEARWERRQWQDRGGW